MTSIHYVTSIFNHISLRNMLSFLMQRHGKSITACCLFLTLLAQQLSHLNHPTSLIGLQQTPSKPHLILGDRKKFLKKTNNFLFKNIIIQNKSHPVAPIFLSYSSFISTSYSTLGHKCYAFHLNKIKIQKFYKFQPFHSKISPFLGHNT